jgi:hypothetical protein
MSGLAAFEGLLNATPGPRQRRKKHAEGIPITEESVKVLVEEAKQRLRRRIEVERSATSR